MGPSDAPAFQKIYTDMMPQPRRVQGVVARLHPWRASLFWITHLVDTPLGVEFSSDAGPLLVVMPWKPPFVRGVQLALNGLQSFLKPGFVHRPLTIRFRNALTVFCVEALILAPGAVAEPDPNHHNDRDRKNYLETAHEDAWTVEGGHSMD